MKWIRSNNKPKTPLLIDGQPKMFDFCLRVITNGTLFILRNKEKKEWRIVKNKSDPVSRILGINEYVTVAQPKTLKAAKITYLMIGETK
jgi:hypothetical protein